MPEFLETCIEAAKAGGEVLIQWKGKAKVREKQPRDLVTEADVAAQQVIREIVLNSFPHHDFLGEETLPGTVPGPADPSVRPEYRWIVDPLDGTMNYVHQLRSYAVSVALERRGEIIAATVLDPELEECYTAERGKGAFLNGQIIQPSECRSLDQALVAASLPAHAPRGSVEVARLVEAVHACRGLRRLGSAALNLCYLAQGRLDAYWATSVKIWDIAAGMLIVTEAGGALSSLSGGPVDFSKAWFAAAATPELHKELLTLLNQFPE